jgi:hypothetical protein
VLDAREAHAARRGADLAARAEAAEAADDLQRAIALDRERLALDPLSEPAARGLVRRLGAADDRAGAMLVYGRLVERLDAELGLAPSAATRRAVAELHADAAPAEAAGALPADDRALAGLPAGACEAERAELLIALGRARLRAGAAGAAVRATFLRAAGHARRAGRRDRLFEAAAGVCALPWFPGDDPVDAQAVALLEEALDGARPADAIRMRALLLREYAFSGEDLVPRAQALVREARGLGDRGALAAALDSLALVHFGVAPPAEREHVAAEMLEVADDVDVCLRARMWRVVARLEAGDLEAAAREAPHFDRPRWAWWPALWAAMRALADDRLDDGEQLAWAAYAIGEAPFGERAAIELQGQIAYVRWRQGRLAELEATAGALAGRHAMLPAWRCVQALVDADLGRVGAARAVLETVEAGHDMGRLITLGLFAEAALAIGDPALLTRAHRELEPYAGRRPVTGYGGLVLMPVTATLERLRASARQPA